MTTDESGVPHERAVDAKWTLIVGGVVVEREVSHESSISENLGSRFRSIRKGELINQSIKIGRPPWDDSDSQRLIKPLKTAGELRATIADSIEVHRDITGATVESESNMIPSRCRQVCCTRCVIVNLAVKKPLRSNY